MCFIEDINSLKQCFPIKIMFSNKNQGEIYASELNINDPLFQVKVIITDSNNYLHNTARQDKDRLYSKFYFAISLILTLFAALYPILELILLVILILGIFLLFSTIKYKKDRKKFGVNREKMKETFAAFGMLWKD